MQKSGCFDFQTINISAFLAHLNESTGRAIAVATALQNVKVFG